MADGGGVDPRLARLGAAVLRRTPFQPAVRQWPRRRLRVLAYHGVHDGDRFAEQVRHLCRTCRTVALADVVAGRRLPERAVLVTFDDGDRSIVSTALPVLRSAGVPAVAFVVADLVGTDRPPWWHELEAMDPVDGPALVRRLKRAPDAERRAQLDRSRAAFAGPAVRQAQLAIDDLRALEAGGVAIGNHSATHPCLDRCDDATIEAELARSTAGLTAALGHHPSAFAYPNGSWDSRARAAVARHGYDVAFTFDHAVGPAPPPDRLAISRIRVDASAPLDAFAVRLSGLHPALHRLRGRR